ncbi:MAG: T9SS type A sorting domain-containing protein [Bacteroidota bacterium]
MFVEKSVFRLCALLLFLPLALSAQLVEEHFDYPLSNSLNLANGGSGQWEGHWYREKGLDVIIEPGSLLVEGLEGTAQGEHLGVVYRAQGIRYNRSFTPIEDDGNSLWVSVIMEYLPEAHPNNVGNITLLKNGQQALTFGRKFGNEKFGVVWPGAGNYNTDKDTDGLHWLVLRVKFSGDANPERVWLWVDPTPNEVPDSLSADLFIGENSQPALRLNNGLDGVQIKVEGTPPLDMRYDALLMGRSFSDVAPFSSANHSVDLPFEQIHFSPNPTDGIGQLTIQTKATFEASIHIYDLMGRSVLQLSPQSFPNATSVPIDLSGLPAGLFQCCLEGDGWRKCLGVVRG